MATLEELKAMGAKPVTQNGQSFTPEQMKLMGARPLTEVAQNATLADAGTPQKESFNYTNDVLGNTPQQKPTGIGSSIFQSTIGSKSLAGVAQMPGKVAGAISEYAPVVGQNQGEKLNNQASDLYNQASDLLVRARSVQDPQQQLKMRASAKSLMKSADDLMKNAQNISGFTDMTGRQAIGTTINAGLTAGTAGTGSLTANATTILGKLGLGALEGAGIGVTSQVASNLNENRPITEGIKKSAIIGAAIPVGTQAISGIKRGLQKTAQLSSEGIINRIIKPGIKDLAYGKEPARGILREKITANSFDDLSNKVSNRQEEIGQYIGKVGTQLEGKIGKTLDLTPALNPINVAMEQAAKTNNQTLLSSLNNVKTALTHALTLSEENGVPTIVKGAQRQLKNVGYSDAVNFMKTIGEHVKYTGNPSDDKLLNSAVQDSQRALRQIMNRNAVKADPKLGKAIIDLNERYSDLAGAKTAIARRSVVEQRNSKLGLIQGLGLTGSMLYSVTKGVTTGDYSQMIKELLTELTATAGMEAAKSMKVQTRIARILDILSPSERAGILRTTPVLKNLYERFTGNKAIPDTINANDIPKQTLSEISGLKPEQLDEILPFLELGKKAANKSGLGESYDKLINSIKEARKPMSFGDAFTGGGPDDSQWADQLLLPAGNKGNQAVELPAKGVLQSQQNLRANAVGLAGLGGVGGVINKVKDMFSNTNKYDANTYIPTQKKEKEYPPTPMIRGAVGNNETGGEKTPYSFYRFSGNKSLGNALGRYQITEGELKTYAKRLLGQTVTSRQFLSTPKLQDKYMDAKIEYLKAKGLSVEEILAAHRGGFSDLSKMADKVKQYKGYVDKAMEFLYKK